MYRLELCFNNEKELKLYRTSFSSGDAVRVAAAGKTGAAHYTSYTFQWTLGMQGLAILLTSTAGSEGQVVLHGPARSAAFALSYALSRLNRTQWLLDVFGYCSSGRPMAERVLNRSFPRSKTGTALVSLNHKTLSPHNISVTVGGKKLTQWEELSALAERLLSKFGRGSSIERQKIVSSESASRKTGSDGGPALLKYSDMSSLEEVEVIASALAEVERVLSATKKVRGSLTATDLSVMENDLPFLAARYSSKLVAQALGGPAQVFINVLRHPCQARFVFTSKTATLSSRLISSSVEVGSFRFVDIYGPAVIERLANKLLSAVCLYLREGEKLLRRGVYREICALNPEVVDDIYHTVRRYLSGVGVEEKILDEFSLFAHVDGRARYLLDSIRYKKVQDAFLSSSAASWMDSEEPLSRYVATEAWYGTSVLVSSDTMSFTDAILPRRRWSGTPDTWKRPIAGFGASEIAVYGIQRACAEPILMGCNEETFSCCAVYKGEFSNSFDGRFLEMPNPIRQLLENRVEDLAALWSVPREVTGATPPVRLEEVKTNDCSSTRTRNSYLQNNSYHRSQG